MAADLLRSLFCCCASSSSKRTQGNGNGLEGGYDETSHLIPETEEPVGTYSEDDLMRQQRFQQRLGDIVRAKEGKMVNVASTIPFNLHNQILPPKAESSTSSSRSASASDYGPYNHHQSYANPYSSQNTYSGQGYQQGYQQQQQQPGTSHYYDPHTGKRRPSALQNHYDSVYHYHDDRDHSSTNHDREEEYDPVSGHRQYRSSSPVTQQPQPRPTPILNIRLVSLLPSKSNSDEDAFRETTGADTIGRGRARERAKQPSGLPVKKGSGGTNGTNESNRTSGTSSPTVEGTVSSPTVEGNASPTTTTETHVSPTSPTSQQTLEEGTPVVAPFVPARTDVAKTLKLTDANAIIVKWD